MSSHFHKQMRMSRRACLRWGAALAAWPVISRAGCPCGDEDNEQEKRDAPVKPPEPLKALRVCADPNNFPFSNRNREGFEDKIASMIAKDLGVPLEYDWLPQRLGFYRNALKILPANLVMAAPAGFDKALISDPYYRSTYVFVYRKNVSTPIHSFDDKALRNVKIGVTLTGGYNTPPTHALAKRKIIDNLTGFTAFDETEGKPGEKIIAAVANGDIDVAIAWGPQAGYFARQQKVELEVVPVSPTEDVYGEAKMPFTFEICMALRRPDKELRKQINTIISNRRKEIDQVLDDFAVPRLPLLSHATGITFDTPVKAAK